LTAPPLYRHRPFLFILLGQLVSELGATLGTLASSWLIFHATGSYTAVGGLWLLYFLPSLAVQLIAGPYLDRWDKKRILVFCQWTRSVAYSLTFAFLLWWPEVHWPFYLTSLINGLIQPLYVPASQALLPTVVKKEQLLQATSYLDAILRMAMICGPVLGGVIVAALEGIGSLVLVAAGFALSGLLLLNSPIQQEKKADPSQTWVVMFLAGLRVFQEKPLLLWLGIFLAFVQFAVGITLVLTIPYIVDELGGSSLHVGIFQAGFPLGYLFGSLLVPYLSRYFRVKHVLMLSSIALGGATFVALGFVENLYLAIGIEVIAGLAMPFFQVHSTNLYQLSVPAELMGRVLSVRLLIMRMTMPLGVWLGGLLGEIVGIRPLYVGMGLLIVAVGLLGLFLPYFRSLSQNHENHKIF
jgi:MFS family permease